MDSESVSKSQFTFKPSGKGSGSSNNVTPLELEAVRVLIDKGPVTKYKLQDEKKGPGFLRSTANKIPESLVKKGLAERNGRKFEPTAKALLLKDYYVVRKKVISFPREQGIRAVKISGGSVAYMQADGEPYELGPGTPKWFKHGKESIDFFPISGTSVIHVSRRSWLSLYEP